MQAVAWWAIPAVATLAALLWAGRAARPRPPADTDETLGDFERFRSALEGRPPVPKRDRHERKG